MGYINKLFSKDKTIRFAAIMSIFLIYFLWGEMIVPWPTIMNKIFSVLFAMGLGLYIILYGKSIKRNPNKEHDGHVFPWLWICIAIYIAYDLFSITYSPVKSFALKKYLVVLPMIFITFGFYYINCNRRITQKIMKAIGWASTTLSLYSYIAYFFVDNGVMPYYRRLSLIIDYNNFATIILIGMITLLFSLIKDKEINRYTIYEIFIISVINAPAIYLSGSRRGILLFIVCMLAFIFTFFLQTKKINGRAYKALFILVIYVGCIFIFTFTIAKAMEIRASYMLEKNAGSEDMKIDKDIASQEQHSDRIELGLSDRYKTIYTGRALSSRRTIWNAAFSEIQGYNIVQGLFGKGSGYDNYMYHNKYKHEMENIYGEIEKFGLGSLHPHNSFISDIINGGVIKLGLAIAIWVGIFIQIWRVLKKDKQSAILLYVVWLVILSNIMISGRYGFIYYKPFWIFLYINYGILDELYNNEPELFMVIQ